MTWQQLFLLKRTVQLGTVECRAPSVHKGAAYFLVENSEAEGERPAEDCMSFEESVIDFGD